MNPVARITSPHTATARPVRGDATVRVVRGNVTWWADAGLSDELFDERGLRLDEWVREGRAEVVKTGAHRTVYRLSLPSGRFYLKHFKIADWRSVLQNVVRPCRALLEWRAAQAVACGGIETFETVAVGITRAGGLVRDNYLLAREIAGAEPLHDFILQRFRQLRPSEQTRFRQALATALGELAGRLHRAGILHRDFHAGNLLLVRDGRRVRLWLIDLHSVRAGRGQVWQLGAGVRHNLAQLNNFFVGLATASDRLRFFRAYWQTRHAGGEFRLFGTGRQTFRRAARAFEKACRREIARTWRRMDRKWARGNRRFVLFEQKNVRGRALTGIDVSGSLPAVPKLPFVRGRDDVRVESLDSRSPFDALLRPFRWSAARRAWEMGHALPLRRIRTPQPLLYCEQQAGGRLQQYVVTEAVPGAVPLADALRDQIARSEAPAAERRLRDLATVVGGELRRLHACGFDQPACTAETLLVREEPPESRGQVWFVSLGEVRCRLRLSRSRAIQNLTALATSLPAGVRRTHSARFLKGYLRGRFRGEWKAVWRDVARRASRQTAVPERGNAWDRLRRAALWVVIVASVFLPAGCRTTPPEVVAPPARHSVRSDRLLILSDFKLPKEHPLVQDLIVLREQIVELLDLPPQREQVIVYLFNTELEYTQFLEATYPGLPSRRAYFVGTPRELAVYTFWGDRVQEDLRHEYTHGVLHASLKTVPLWLDEGLAEYFEVIGSEPGEVNREYALRLSAALANGWRPDLERLERIEKFEQMQRTDYQEAWAWVHFMLHSTPEAREALLGFLQDLRSNGKPLPLSSRLQQGQSEYAMRFLNYLATLPRLPAVAAETDSAERRTADASAAFGGALDR